jgi:diguanylate cyclase (GGDEF)-like protein
VDPSSGEFLTIPTTIGQVSSSEKAQDRLDKLRARNAVLDHKLFDYHALLKASEALHDELDLESLCEVALAMFKERLVASTGAILLYDDAQQSMGVMISTGLGADAEAVVIPIGEGILWRLLLAAEPFAVVDSAGKHRFRALFKDHAVALLQSSLWVPLVKKGALVGVVALGGIPDGPLEGERHEADMSFLATLSSQAAIAMSTARLYSQVVTARRDLDRSLHNLSMLFDVARALAAVGDLSKLLRIILQRATDAVGASKGSLMLLDEATEVLSVRVVIGLKNTELMRQIEAGEVQCSTFKRGEGVAGRVLETGVAMRIDDTEEDGMFAHRDGSYAQSLVCLPMKVDGSVIGVLNVSNRVDGPAFSDDDVELLEAMASQASIAIARMKLYELAIRDDLTGLLLRRFITERLQQELRRAGRYDDDLTVMMCDIDHFKKVNDTWGHPAGDAVLVKVAETLVEELRMQVDLPARWGGEEFLVVMPQTTEEEALAAAERLRARLNSTPIRLPGDLGETEITMSFGLASTATAPGEDPETADSIIKRADDALYVAKRTGRNKVVCWTLISEADPESEGG